MNQTKQPALSAILVALVAVAVLSAAATNSLAHNSDCMKNPFASGCRGISAKRSQSALWGSPQQDNSLDGSEQATRASFYEMLAAARQPSGAAAGQQQLRIHQLGAVLDLLTEATNRLALVGTLSGASPSSNHLTAGDSTPASYMPEALKRHQAGQKESRD